MKTPSNIQDEIDVLVSSLTAEELRGNASVERKREISKIRKRVSFLREMKRYVELPSTTEESVRAQQDKLKRLIKAHNYTWDNLKEQYLANKIPLDKIALRRRGFRKLHDIPLMEKQLKNLNYLLSNE